MTWCIVWLTSQHLPIRRAKALCRIWNYQRLKVLLPNVIHKPLSSKCRYRVIISPIMHVLIVMIVVVTVMIVMIIIIIIFVPPLQHSIARCIHVLHSPAMQITHTLAVLHLLLLIDGLQSSLPIRQDLWWICTSIVIPTTIMSNALF